jgi:hypothetical protein
LRLIYKGCTGTAHRHFFSSPKHYYSLKPRATQSFEDEFLVDVLDAEVKALHKLWSSAPPASDDRRGAIEIQFEKGHVLKKSNLLAVIMPDIYLEHKQIRKYLANYGAKLHGYSVYSLNSAAYFSQIYHFVKRFYEAKSCFNV